MGSSENLIYLSGVLLLAAWLLSTGLGARALEHAPVRRTRLSPLVLPAAFVFWMGPTQVAMSAASPWIRSWPEWHKALFGNAVMCGAALVTVLGIGAMAYWGFARRLKGLGLGLRHMHRDLVHGGVTLLAIWPVMTVATVITIQVGKACFGPEYELPKHPELNLLVEHPEWLLRISVAVVAVVAAPLSEEFLFRGLIQSLIRSRVDNPWLAIFPVAVTFALIHPDRAHWPALFVLGLGLGYAYERSGSLWQPICMHALFNGVVVASFLM